MKTCEMPDCNEKHRAKGLCLRHHQQARRLGVEPSVEGLLAVETPAPKRAQDYTTTPYEDAINRPWQEAVRAHQARAHHQRQEAEAASQVALAAFPLQTETTTAPLGSEGWSVGDHVLCGWTDGQRRAFMQQGVDAFLAAGGPEECLRGHQPRRN